MTVEMFIAALKAEKKKKEVEDYVDGVLEGMSEEDLNGKIGEEDEIFDFRVTDKS